MEVWQNLDTISHPKRNLLTSEPEMETVSSKTSKQSWARLIQKVYEVDPLICQQCGHEMKVIAVITDPFEVSKILEYLKRNNAHRLIKK